MDSLAIEDLKLVNKLSSRRYSGNSLLSNASRSEQSHLKEVKRKLRALANYFKDKYDDPYGIFESSVSSGNPIGRGATLNNVWSAISKGATNKQYSAQIGFVINKEEPSLNVGFYFGRASARGLSPQDRARLESRLNTLGIGLSETVQGSALLNQKYQELFDYGFKAYSEGNIVDSNKWLDVIHVRPKGCQIIAKISPNDFGIIENSVIDYFVSQVAFLMTVITQENAAAAPKRIKPLTPEQRAKQAERLAQIGLKGELYVMKIETERIKALKESTQEYPRHIALESMDDGYDILSIDENNDEIQIEVKTTTRPLTDNYSRRFFISYNEYKFYLANKKSFRLYRVYDVENSPSFEIIDLNGLTPEADGYVVSY